MKTIKRSWKLFVAAAVAVVLGAGALAGHLAGLAAASGIPKTDPLYYSGVLADTSGKMLSGSYFINVKLYKFASGGTAKCSSGCSSETVTQGRFRVKLPSACITAIQKNPDLWTEVTMGTTSCSTKMGRQKIGAVPYAVEAESGSATSTDPDCPPGYAKDSTVTLFTLCKKGKDEMVKVGSSWVDRYEANLVDATTWNGGKCDGSGTVYGSIGGASPTDDYPSTFPDSGNWLTRVYACSVPGNVPSRMMTWFQAQQACLLAGKRLCTNGEWQGAAAGTYDQGSYNGAGGGSCHTNGSAPRKTGQAGLVPGASTSCISSWGAEDMIGNLAEWVDMWGQAGKVSTTFSSGAKATPWPLGYGDSQDATLNINGDAHNGSTWKSGLPAAARRGGDYGSGVGGGVFTMFLDGGPSAWEKFIGARCCRQ